MTQQTQPKLRLISHKLCPYVQRAVIALQELGIDYERNDIDLENPPQWFKRLSPLGKVPILVVDDDIVLFESAVIAEYLNEIGGGSLLSGQAIERARQRAWIEFASATLDNIGGLYSANGEKAYQNRLAQLDSKWQLLEAELGGGDYFDSARFSLVDAAFGPVFRYLDLFEKLTGDEFLAAYPKLARWRKSLQSRHSVIHAVSPEYQHLLTGFLASKKSWLGEKAARYQDDREAA